MSSLLWLGVQRGADGRCQAIPALRFFAQPAAARSREAVELGAAVVIGSAPFGSEEPLVLETGERRVKRALLGEQSAPGDLLDPQKYAVAVEGAERYSL